MKTENNKSMSKFSIRLKSLRKKAGISQKQLSIDSNVNLSSIKHYEGGLREPSGNTLIALADYFNVSPEYLIGLSDITHPLYAHNDPDIMDVVNSSWNVLFSSIEKALQTNEPITQKFSFNLLVELRHVLNSNTLSNNQKAASITLIHDIVSSLVLSFDRAANNPNNDDYSETRIETFIHSRVKEYESFLVNFFKDYYS